MLPARTEHRQGIDPACVLAPSVCPFLSLSGEHPPTEEAAVMANSLGTISTTGLPPLLLRLRDVLHVTRLKRATLYRYMSAGLFPFPVSLGPRAVRWLHTDVLAYQEGLYPTGHTPNIQGQTPAVVIYPTGRSRPLSSGNMLGTSEIGITITFTKGHEIVPTTWPFPGLLREEEVIHLLAWSRSSLRRALKTGLFPEPVKMGPRTIGWHIKTILTYVQNLPSARHTCHDKDSPHSLADCPAAGRTSKGTSAYEVARKTVPHVRSKAA